MKAIMMLLIGCCLLLTISGCSTKLVFVPSGCNIKEVDHAVIDYSRKDTLVGESKQCVKNYTAVKEENEILRKVINACR
jgi:hypothetical protein